MRDQLNEDDAVTGNTVEARRAAYNEKQLELALAAPPVTPQKDAPRLEPARKAAGDAVRMMFEAPPGLAHRYASELARRQSTSLVGKTIRSARDLAFAAQVYRDPRFETLRYFLADKDGKIVGQLGISSRLPAASEGFIGPAEWMMSKLADRARAFGATTLWMQHNHPSGDSSPSEADRRLTVVTERMLPAGLKLGGHVVIDHNNWSEILGGAGTDMRHEEPALAGEDLAPKHDYYSTIINGPGDIARLSSRLKASENDVVLILADARHKIVNIATVPASHIEALEEKRLGGMIARLSMRAIGTDAIFAVVRSKPLHDKLSKHVFDSVLIDENGTYKSAAEAGFLRRPSRVSSRFNVRARVSPDTSEAFDYLRPHATRIRTGKFKPHDFDIEDRTGKYKVTSSPAFKEWFGQSVITVDGKAGSEPLVVYHGTDRSIRKFKTPAYFTEEPTFADVFSNSYGTPEEAAGAQTYPVYLRIENPYYIDPETSGRHFEWDAEDVADMKAQGFDGVVIPPVEGESSGIYTVFDANQVKSATGNRGTFDRSKPDITLSQEEAPDRRKDAAARKRVDEMTPEELKQALLTHELTGIPNRRAYDEAEKQPIQASIDVDSLKWVNDNMTHGSGDELLKAVAEALEAEFGDQAYHISGDEFVIQAADRGRARAMLAVVQAKLRKATIEAVTEDGQTVRLKGVGISYGLGEDLDAAEEALRLHKERRQARGERAARGEVPAGVETTQGRYDQERDTPDDGARLSQEEGDVTDTEAFKRWFAGSKVVDDKGDPLVVYHGTTGDFDVFEKGDVGFHFGNLKQSHDRLKDKEIKEQLDEDEVIEYGTNLMPVYLRIENPLRLVDPGTFKGWGFAHAVHDALSARRPELEADFRDDFADVLDDNMAEDREDQAAADIASWLLDRGIDGIVYKNLHEGIRQSRPGEKAQIKVVENKGEFGRYDIPGRYYAIIEDINVRLMGSHADTEAEALAKGTKLMESGFHTFDDSWVAFRPNQIKSAIGNTGAFDPFKAEITLQQDQEPGAQPGEESIKKGYQAIAQKAIDFWNEKIGWRYGPLGKLPAQRQYLKDRYEALGKVGESQDVAKKVYAALSRADDADQKAVYDFLTTQDAKPNLIRDEKVRSSAVAAKQTIDAVGQRLVEYGLLSSAAYESHRGSYLPRVYLKHLLGEQAIRAIGSGKRLSDLGYLKKRQDLDEETRKVILGEITDPAFLASFGLSRTMRDLAIFDFLDTIAGNKEWVAPGATVEWRGRNVSPAWLNREAQELRRRSKLYKPEERAKALVIAESMEDTAESGLSELEDVDLSAYQQIPDTARYGVLRGTWVRQEIHNDLVGANSFIPPDAGWAESLLGQGGALTQVQQWWKMSKVALNPPTQVRNFLSNMILLHLSGVPAHRVFSGELVVKAINSIRTQDRYFQVAKKYGLFSTTFANQELRRISDAWIAMQKEGGASIGKLKAMAAELTNFAGDIYQLLEAIGKIAKLRDAIDREGMSDSDAMIEAHETLFDYSLIPRSVQYLRNAPIGVPFLTFMYKMIPQMAKTVVRHPLRFAPYVALPWILNELLKELYDVDDDDLDKLREAFPRWMQERGNMLLLPFKDDNGRWQVVDLGYLLPWGALSNAMAAVGEGEYVAGARDLGLLSGPIPSVITAITTNTDPFTGEQIVHPEDSAFDQVSQLVNYVWNLAMPGFVGDYGAIQRMIDAAGGKVDRLGNPTYTKGQALLRAFGINVYPVDPEATRASNMRGMGFEIEDIGARRNERLRDPNLTDEEREEIRAVYRELIDRASERLRQYREESEVHPNLATGGELEDVEPAAQ